MKKLILVFMLLLGMVLYFDKPAYASPDGPKEAIKYNMQMGGGRALATCDSNGTQCLPEEQEDWNSGICHSTDCH